MDDKKCNDCIHFREYYIKMKTRFYNTYTGVCGHAKRDGRKKINTVCEFFDKKDLAIEKEKRLIYLKDYLAEVAKRLTSIEQLLIDDYSTFDKTN